MREFLRKDQCHLSAETCRVFKNKFHVLIDVKRFYNTLVLLANYISKKVFYGNYGPNLPANLISNTRISDRILLIVHANYNKEWNLSVFV